MDRPAPWKRWICQSSHAIGREWGEQAEKYMEHLEAENAALRKRVEELEFDNEVLRGELKNPL